jgi:hypothetical protein
MAPCETRTLPEISPFTLHAPISMPVHLCTRQMLEVYGMHDVMGSIKFATFLYNCCRPQLCRSSGVIISKIHDQFYLPVLIIDGSNRATPEPSFKSLAVQCGDRGVEHCVESEWTIVGNGLSLVILLGDSSATSSAVVRILD